MTKIQLSLTLLCGLVLAGCESRIDYVNNEMAIIRTQPPLPIEPAPVFTPVPNYHYAVHRMKSPFLPTSLALELQTMAGKRVFPNMDRTPQPLESYALESLNVKGSMRNDNGHIVAFIETPDKEIERIQVGSYMGMNHGRVVRITPTQIDIVEIIPDGREGYVERPRSLVLLEASS